MHNSRFHNKFCLIIKNFMDINNFLCFSLDSYKKGKKHLIKTKILYIYWIYNTIDYKRNTDNF